MMRKLRVFGVALAGTLILSSFAATAANAGIFFEVGATPTSILAKASQFQEWTIGGHTVVCQKFSADTAETKTFSTSDLLLENFKYESCTEPAFPGRTATVTLSCKVDLFSEKTVSKTESTGSTSITKCPGTPPGYEINITSGSCVMKVPEQTSKTAEFFASTEFGDITYWNVNKSLDATFKGFLCGEGIELNGVMKSYGTLNAENTTLTLSNIP